jgi:hypothetical protein
VYEAHLLLKKVCLLSYRLGETESLDTWTVDCPLDQFFMIFERTDHFVGKELAREKTEIVG